MLRAIHFSPLPCSDLGQGVAISAKAFKLPRFFVEMPSSSCFFSLPRSLGLAASVVHLPVVMVGCARLSFN